MRNPTRMLGLVAVFVTSFACKDDSPGVGHYVDAWPDTVCNAVVECACDYPNGAQLEHCKAQLGVVASTLAELNSVEGLRFDGHCAQKAVDAINDLGCGVAVPDPNAECERPCKVWYGPEAKGGSCTSVNGFDNCKPGLTCNGGVCVDPCDDPDLPGIGEACAPQYGCAEGAWCDDRTTPLFPTCAALPLVGQPCLDPQLPAARCAEDLICDTSMPAMPVCAVLPQVGAPCIDGFCDRELYCDVAQMPATCAALPVAGQPCQLGQCATPFECDGMTCVQPRPAVCGYYGGLPDDVGPVTGVPGSDSGVGSSGGGATGGLDTGLDGGTTGLLPGTTGG